MADSETHVSGRVVAGRYRLVRELGRGGMGVVWLAEDQLVGREVAVKELRPPQGLAGGERETLTRRALAEARSAARIHHPGAVTLFDVLPASADDDAIYLIMELVDGVTLAQLIYRGGPQPAPVVAGYGLQLLSVLEAAHGLGIVHRDIKPANIMITRSGQAKLTDFGIAHTLGDPRLTASGVMGTQAYMAPELFEAAPITPAADLWALGATLFAAAEGRGPFDRDTTGAIIRAILIDELPAPTGPSPLSAAITGLLQRDPARRATIGQARGQLQQAAQLQAPPRPTAGPAATTGPAAGHRGPATVPAAVGPAAGHRGPATVPAATGHRGPAAAHPDTWELAPTSLSPSAPPVVAPHPAPQVHPPGHGRRPVIIAAIAAGALLVAAAVVVPVLVLSGTSGTHATPAIRKSSIRKSSALQPAATLAGGGTGVSSVAFSPDGKTLAVGDDYGLTMLWDVATRGQGLTLTDPQGSNGVAAVAFSPDGKTLAVADRDDRTYLWNVAAGKVVATLSDPDAATSSASSDTGVNSVAFSPDGQTLATGDEDDRTYLWNVSTGQMVATLTDPGGTGDTGGVASVAFSPDGKTLAAGDGDGSAYLWDVATRNITAKLADPPGSTGGVASVAFSPDGQMLATGDFDDSTYLWTVSTGQMVATLPDRGGKNAAVYSVAFSPGGQMLAVGDEDDSTYLWDVATRRVVATLRDPGPPGTNGSTGVESVAFSPNGKTLVTGDYDDNTYLWDIG